MSGDACGIIPLKPPGGQQILRPPSDGPSVTFKSGGDNKKAEQTLADSGLVQLAAGGEVDCVVSPQAKVSLAVLKDVYTRNTTEGLLVMGRIIIPF